MLRMARKTRTLAAETYDNLAKLRNARQQLKGPFEQWNLVVFRSTLVYLTRSLDGIVELTRQEGKATLEDLLSLPVNSELLATLQDIYSVLGLVQMTEEDSLHIKQAERFYRRILDDMNYSTVGEVIEALRRREVPEKVVRTALLNAYLHAQVREAIKDGYGLAPLIPPEPQRLPNSTEQVEKGI